MRITHQLTIRRQLQPATKAVHGPVDRWLRGFRFYPGPFEQVSFDAMKQALLQVETNRGYRVHPSVAVRPEPFGALVYHYGNRKLVFLKSKQLVTVVEGIGAHGSIDAALDAAGLVEPTRSRYVEALSSMFRSDMLELQEIQ